MKRILYSLALATLAVSAGCQVPGVQPRPHVVVQFNTLQLAPDADLAITLDFRTLLGTKYLQAVTTTGPRPVHRIVARVTGDNIADQNGIAPVEIIPQECPSGIAVINFTNLPAGKVHVVVNTYDINEQIITTGDADPTVVPGSTIEVPVRCTTELGNLKVVFTCPENCDGPTPTPTSTPTPARTPNVPVDPTAAGLVSRVRNLFPDEAGNVHLLAMDPGLPFNTADDQAYRVVKVPADASNAGTVYADDLLGTSADGVEIAGHTYVGNYLSQPDRTHYYLPEYNAVTGERIALHDPTFTGFPVGQSSQALGGGMYTSDSANQPVLSMHGNAFATFGIKQLPVDGTIYFAYQSQPLYNTYTGIKGLVMDPQDNPIFAAGTSIYTGRSSRATASPNPVIPATTLATISAEMAGSNFFGLAKTDVASQFLVSLTANTHIYLWDRNAPATFTPAATMPGGEFPLYIKRSTNGQYFVLAAKTAVTNTPIDNYRVYRFDMVAGNLVNPTLLVSHF